MFFLKVLARLPLPVLYLFSDFLFAVAFYLVKYRRKIVVKNLKNSFPEKGGEEIGKIERKFYHNLCDYVVETLKLLTISEEELKRRIKFTNPEVMQPYKDKGQSLLYLASHQFNWEWLISAANLWLPIPVDYVYQPQRSEMVNRFSLMTRGRFGAYAVKRAEVVREMIKRRDIIRGISIVADQFPGHGNDKRYWTEFLHQDTAFFEGVNNLATMMQYPVFYGKVKKVNRGFYEMEFVKLGDPPFENGSVTVIENYIKETEQVIQNDPAGWLWSHNRWKKSRNDP
ncbi:MAG: lysophospholipid acyltransferase family protein [Cyclobacteriaceae bacterium]